MRRRLRALFENIRARSGLDLRSTARWLVLASLVGAVSGAGAIAFHWLSQGISARTLGDISGYYQEQAAGEHVRFAPRRTPFSPWAIVLVMAAGGLASGAIVYAFAPEAEGHGTDAAIDAYHRRRGAIRPVVPLVKTVASAITLGTGGSGGREGPIAQIGAGFGSFLAACLRLPVRDRRILLASGMGAGVGAIFRAPLAGALFAAEILYRGPDLESEVILPAAFSSIVAYVVFCLSLPPELRFTPLFGSGLDFRMGSFIELLPLAALALVLALAGSAYVRAFYGTRRLFGKIPLPRSLLPALGALAAGLLGIGLYAAMGGDRAVLAVISIGYGALQEALSPGSPLAATTLLAIAFGKIATTSLTIGSGGSAGVFGPSMVIGGSLGGAFGLWLHALWPDLVPEPRAYVIVGMTGFFAGCAHAPLSTIVMVAEMTGSYRLLLPATWVSTICFLSSGRWTLYRSQPASPAESPAHRGDFLVDVLQGLRVRDIFRPDLPRATVSESATLEEVLRLIPRTSQRYFPVVDDRGILVGIFSEKDIRPYTYDEALPRIAIASDFMATDILSVTLDDDLHTALRRFTAKNLDELPVLDGATPGKYLGMVRRRDAVALYNERISELKARGAE